MGKNGDVALQTFSVACGLERCVAFPWLDNWTGAPAPAGRLPDLIPGLGVDSGETVRVRQNPRRDADGIPWLAGERRLAGKNGSGIMSFGRRRGDADLRRARRPMELELWPRGFSGPF